MEGLEEPLLRIGDHGKRNVKLLFEGRGFLRCSQPDEHHPGTEPLKSICFLTQLRHLIPAEGSPVMAQENQYQRSAFPEAAEARNRVVPQHHFLIPDFRCIFRHRVSLFTNERIPAGKPGVGLLLKPGSVDSVSLSGTGNGNNIEKDGKKVKDAAGQ